MVGNCTRDEWFGLGGVFSPWPEISSRQIQTADLHLPAEDIEKRSFVAIPLAEVAPDVTMPGMGIRLREIAARFTHSQMPPVALTDDLRREWAASGGANECQQSQAAHS
jgi:hypothetical protein